MKELLIFHDISRLVKHMFLSLAAAICRMAEVGSWKPYRLKIGSSWP